MVLTLPALLEILTQNEIIKLMGPHIMHEIPSQLVGSPLHTAMVTKPQTSLTEHKAPYLFVG